MKVLKVVFEIPLAEKAHVASLMEAGKLVAEFGERLTESHPGSSHTEVIMNRSGKAG